jgi:hypothetical protein
MIKMNSHPLGKDEVLEILQERQEGGRKTK